MEIKKRTRVVVKTRKEFFVRQARATERTICADCGGALIPERVGADFFSISSRLIYRLIEAGQIHFIEKENEVYVCSTSLEKL